MFQSFPLYLVLNKTSTFLYSILDMSIWGIWFYLMKLGQIKSMGFSSEERGAM